MGMTNSDADGRARDPQAQAALDAWQRIFLGRDWDALPALLADDVTFHTPVDAMPLRGKEAFVASLRQSFSIFENFEYARGRCQTNSNQSQLGQWHCRLCRVETSPFVESGSSGQLEIASLGEAALLVEMV